MGWTKRAPIHLILSDGHTGCGVNEKFVAKEHLRKTKKGVTCYSCKGFPIVHVTTERREQITKTIESRSKR